MSDLRIIVDDPEGLRIALTGAYEDWTLGTVQWVEPYQGFVVGEGVLDPSAVNGSEVRAVVQATGPDGGSATLMTPYVYVDGAIQSVRIDLDTQGAAPSFAFAFASVEGVASYVEYKFQLASYAVRVAFDDRRGVDYQLHESDPSKVKSTVELDLFEGFNWSERYSDFDTEGRLTRIVTDFDDGTVSQSKYRYDGTQLIQETHVNRLGLYEDTRYEDGLIAWVERVDDAEFDAYNFTTDLTRYIDGIISMRNLQLDNGVGISWTYQSGVLAYRSKFDYLDAYAYDNQVTFFNAEGLAQSGGQTMDDGRQIEFGYTEGVRDYAMTTDAEDTYTWSSKLDFYRTDGGSDLFAMHRNTTFDDGRHLYARYEMNDDGGVVVRQSTLSDLEDAFAWATRERSHDEDGVLTHEVFTFDDGALRESQYEGGLRASSSTSDAENARPFEWVQRTYEEGELQTVLTTMDDGRLIERRYVDAELSSVVSADQGDAFLWSDRIDFYDASELATRATLFDDGVTHSEQFDQGQRTFRQRSDENDVHEWHSISERFEDGIRVSRDVILDDDLLG